MSKKKMTATAQVAEAPASDEDLRPVEVHEDLADVAVAEMRPGPWQYRKRFDETKLEELARSMARKGQLQRVLLRRADEGFEIIGGERRWRAAQRIGLATLRASILDVDDETALEMCVAENAQRDDVHPLDECDAFRTMRDRHGRSVEQIAARIGRGIAYVYERLALEYLGEPARDAYFEGRITLGVALALATVRDSELQVVALEDLTKHLQPGESPSVARARETIKTRYHLRLADAPFDTASGGLVPSAGSCVDCPKRSGNQGTLFADAWGRDNVCLDRACWDSKRDASWAEKVSAATAAGRHVITSDEAKKLWPYGAGSLQSPKYVDLDAMDYRFTDGKTWRRVLGKERLRDVAIVLARSPAGTTHELAVRSQVLRVVENAPSEKDPAGLRAHVEAKTQVPDRDPKAESAMRKAQLDHQAEKEGTARAVRALVRTVESGVSDDQVRELWLAIAMGVIGSVALGDPSDLRVQLFARGVELDKDAHDEPEQLYRWACDATLRQIFALVVDLVASTDTMNRELDHRAAFFRALAIDHKHHVREARKELAAAEKAKGKKSKAASDSDEDAP
jgi:ParB/RepB/Spo0J family partition protein